jgi:hypothetical protein
MSRFTRFTPVFVSFLFVMGFSLHVSNLGQYVAHGQTHLETLISRTSDGALAGWMAWCAVLLIFGAKSFFATYEVHGWRKVVYWVATGYVTLSLPGHFKFLASGDVSYFQIFPWWFSAVLLGCYTLLIAFFLSMKPKEGASGKAVHQRSGKDAAVPRAAGEPVPGSIAENQLSPSRRRRSV